MSPTPNQPKETPKRGSTLMLVIFVLFLVMLVISAVYMLAKRNLLAVNEDYWNDKAQYAARAGIEHTIAHLTANPTFGSMVTATIPTTSVQDEPDLTYEVEVLNNTSPDPTVQIPAPDNMMIPPGVCWVRSTGNLRDRVDSKASSLVRLVGYQRPILKHALFGMDNITISNNSRVEGWDSTDPAAPQPNRGDIGTNSTLPGAVIVNSAATVDGGARAGVGTLPADLASVVNPAGGAITGLIQISEEATQIPRFIIDPTVTENPYKFRMAYGLGNLTPPIAGEDPALNYYHKIPFDTDPMPADQSPVSVVRRKGPDGTDPTGVYASDDVASYYLAPTAPPPTPEETLAQNQMLYRPYVPGGGYQLDPGPSYAPVPAAAGDANTPNEEVGPGTILLRDVILRRAIYYFKGDLILDGHINVDPAPAVANTENPCLIYVDGNVTVMPGAKINWDGYNSADLNANTVMDEPLQPRLLQIYSVIDPGTSPPVVHTVKIGDTASPRTQASFVLCGANMNVEMHETDYYGGAQTRSISVLDNTNAHFDIDIYGKPLEGRGELAVLVSTVSVFRTSAIAASGPPPPPPPAPPGPGPSAPVPPAYTSTGWCSPIIPLPYNGCAY